VRSPRSDHRSGRKGNRRVAGISVDRLTCPGGCCSIAHVSRMLRHDPGQQTPHRAVQLSSRHFSPTCHQISNTSTTPYDANLLGVYLRANSALRYTPSQFADARGRRRTGRAVRYARHARNSATARMGWLMIHDNRGRRKCRPADGLICPGTCSSRTGARAGWPEAAGAPFRCGHCAHLADNCRPAGCGTAPRRGLLRRDDRSIAGRLG
jgi:hypothetical protein